jgi:hypothetical protein
VQEARERFQPGVEHSAPDLRVEDAVAVVEQRVDSIRRAAMRAAEKLAPPREQDLHRLPVLPARAPLHPHEGRSDRVEFGGRHRLHLHRLGAQGARGGVHCGKPFGIRLLEVLAEVAQQTLLIAQLAGDDCASEQDAPLIGERQHLLASRLYCGAQHR